MRWKKSALKSNKMKMGQGYKWSGSDDAYEVTLVRSGDDAPASYLLMYGLTRAPERENEGYNLKLYRCHVRSDSTLHFSQVGINHEDFL
jgi:hypothetical protein